MHFRLVALISVVFSIAASAQNLVVTEETHHGTTPANLTKSDISVEINHKRAEVRDWIPLTGNRAGLDLYIAIDDGTDTDLGIQFASLKNFINGQSGATRIGLAYLRHGEADIVAPLTADHEQTAKKLRLPTAQPGISASPYVAISDLVKKWPATGARREVLLIGSGIDLLSPPDPENLYLQKAIADAQRAGILVHSIYYAEAGHLGHSYWRISWGQSYLSELGDETGGEAYWQGIGSPVSFDPFLKDLDERLKHQYLLVVDADAHKSDLEPIRVTTAIQGISAVAASKIYFGE